LSQNKDSYAITAVCDVEYVVNKKQVMKTEEDGCATLQHHVNIINLPNSYNAPYIGHR
jgi:hypothetical protein